MIAFTFYYTVGISDIYDFQFPIVPPALLPFMHDSMISYEKESLRQSWLSKDFVLFGFVLFLLPWILLELRLLIFRSTRFSDVSRISHSSMFTHVFIYHVFIRQMTAVYI